MQQISNNSFKVRLAMICSQLPESWEDRKNIVKHMTDSLIMTAKQYVANKNYYEWVIRMFYSGAFIQK